MENLLGLGEEDKQEYYQMKKKKEEEIDRILNVKPLKEYKDRPTLKGMCLTPGIEELNRK